MAGGPETMPVKKDVEQRTEERGEMWYQTQLKFQGDPQEEARQASPGTGMGAGVPEWRQEKGPRGPEGPPNLLLLR